MIVEITINFLFLIEMFVDIFLSASIAKAYSRKFRIWPETVCQFLNLYAVM